MHNRVELDWNLCRACRPCEARRVCKPRALVKIDLDEPVYLDYDRCLGCAVCVPACPFSALRLRPLNSTLREG